MRQAGSGLSRLPRWMVVAAFVASVASLLLYVVHFGRVDFSSDDAVMSMLADSMWQQGTLFPTGWISNNGDLMIPSGAVIIAPLLGWFPNGFELHSAISVLATMLMIGAFGGFLHSARLPVPVILLACAMLATGPSRISAIMLYLQTTNVWQSAGFFLGATLIWRRRSLIASKLPCSAWELLGLSVIVLVVAFENPKRALVMLTFPLYVFDRVLAFQMPRTANPVSANAARILGLLDTGVVLGIAVPFAIALAIYYGLFYLGITQTVNNAASLHWDGIRGVSEHARVFLHGWIPYLGGEREHYASAASIGSLLHPVRQLIAFWLTWVGIAELARLHRNESPLRTALVLAFAAAFFPTLCLFLAFSPLAIDDSTLRYFTVPVLMLLAIAAIRVASATGWKQKLATPAAAIASVFLILVSTARIVPAMTREMPSPMAVPSSQAQKLAELLVREKLRWGYATWWNAGASTVLSGGAVRVNPVYLMEGGITPFNYMIQRAWYKPESWRGPSFLALQKGEDTPERLVELKRSFGEASRTIENANFSLLVYDWNISSNFNCDQGAANEEKPSPGFAEGAILSATISSRGEGGAKQVATVLIRNSGAVTLMGIGAEPVAIGVSLLHDGAASGDWIQLPLSCSIHAQDSRAVVVELPKYPASVRLAQLALFQKREGRWIPLQANSPLRIALPLPPGPEIFAADFDRP
jgi:hypothetical protein